MTINHPRTASTMGECNTPSSVRAASHRPRAASSSTVMASGSNIAWRRRSVLSVGSDDEPVHMCSQSRARTARGFRLCWLRCRQARIATGCETSSQTVTLNPVGRSGGCEQRPREVVSVDDFGIDSCPWRKRFVAVAVADRERCGVCVCSATGPVGPRSAPHSGCVGRDVVELQCERDSRVHPHQDGDVRDAMMTKDVNRPVVEALGDVSAGG